MEKVLIGYGGFSREIMADIGREIRCFVDDEYVIIGKTNKLSNFDSKKHEALIAIGDPNIRKKLVDKLPSDTIFWNHISKHAIIMDPLISFGVGNVICAGVIITTNVSIGNHVHLNLSTTVGHDSVVGNYVTTAPNVSISGNVSISDGVYIGTNSVIREKINICSNVVLGLNCGVTKNIDESGTYVGTPSIKIK